MREVEPPDAAAFERASAIVRATLTPTPLLRAPALGPDVYLKLETFQPTGSFKVRGGLAAVAAARVAPTPVPLVAASAGNHGLGLLYAADRLGADATVVVAEGASEAKIAAMQRFGPRVVRHGHGYDEAERYALELAEARGGRFVSPYNDPDVIAGQSTVGAEILEQLPGVATIVVPVGGGGLLSGVGLAVAGHGVRVVGVEAAPSVTMAPAVAAGEAVHVEVGDTIADGLAGNIEPGSVTVSLAGRVADRFVAVPEEEIRHAMRVLAFEYGVVAEGAGATATAAVLSGALGPDTGPTVVLVTGRNIAPVLLASVLEN